MTDEEFEVRLKNAVIRGAEQDYMPAHAEIREIETRSKPHRALCIAACIAVCLVVLVALSMISPTVRASVYNMKTVDYEEQKVYWLSQNFDADVPQSVTLGYVPKGFEFDNESYDELSSEIKYNSAKNGNMYIVILGDIGYLEVDNQNARVYSTTLNNHTVDIYKSTDERFPNRIVCYDESTGLIICIEADISVRELKKVVENLQY